MDDLVIRCKADPQDWIEFEDANSVDRQLSVLVNIRSVEESEEGTTRCRIVVTPEDERALFIWLGKRIHKWSA